MARKRQEESKGGGSPAWMATFSDLMNLLLCFFVLLFAMSSVDEEKYELVVASITKSFSVLNGGTDTIGEGELVGAGVSMLSNYDIYLNELANSTVANSVVDNDSQKQGSEGNQESQNSGQSDSNSQNNQTDANNGNDKSDGTASGDADKTGATAEEIEEQYEQLSLSETEQMAEEMKKKAQELGIEDVVEIDYTSDYVVLNISGALLFESGSADIQKGAEKILDKIGQLILMYENHIVEVEGHTDNVPISTTQFASNEVLSTFRALSVADYIMSTTDIDPHYVKYSGRGEYDPIADNSTAKGRAKNRRVEIKIYSSYNSD